MKIIVIGTPRTATSVTCELISKKFNLQNLEYISNFIHRYIESRNAQVDHDQLEILIQNKLITYDNIVLKTVGKFKSRIQDKLGYLQEQTDYYSQFDKIVFCSRQNLLHQYHSWLHMNESRNLPDWFTLNDSLMETSIASVNVDIPRWSFENSQQVHELIDCYITLYKNIPKSFQNYTIQITHLTELCFDDRILNFQKLQSKLTELCPNKCYNITYEMWQKPVAESAADLSAALNIPITENDLKTLENKHNGIVYENCITNITEVNNLYSSFNLTP